MICWWSRLQWRVPSITMFLGVPFWMLSSCLRIWSIPRRLSAGSSTPPSGARVAAPLSPTFSASLSVNMSGRYASLCTSAAGSSSDALAHMLSGRRRLPQHTTSAGPLRPPQRTAAAVPSCNRRADAQTACCSTTAHRHARSSARGGLIGADGKVWGRKERTNLERIFNLLAPRNHPATNGSDLQPTCNALSTARARDMIVTGMHPLVGLSF